MTQSGARLFKLKSAEPFYELSGEFERADARSVENGVSLRVPLNRAPVGFCAPLGLRARSLEKLRNCFPWEQLLNIGTSRPAGAQNDGSTRGSAICSH